MWHVSSRTGMATLRTAMHLLLLTYLLTYILKVWRHLRYIHSRRFQPLPTVIRLDHNRELPDRLSHLVEPIFITRMLLFYQSY